MERRTVERTRPSERIHRLIAERLDKPLSEEMTTAIKELSNQTIKIRRRHEIHSFGRFVLWLIILWNLFRAVFIGG
jgi:hypothetical protein